MPAPSSRCRCCLSAPLLFLALLAGKVVSKIFGLYPIIGLFRQERNERWYYTLMMSTGLTFGTISSLYGLAHGIVTQEQYSFLVAAVIASAVVPTVIAGRVCVPQHLLPHDEKYGKGPGQINGLSEEGLFHHFPLGRWKDREGFGGEGRFTTGDGLNYVSAVSCVN